MNTGSMNQELLSILVELRGHVHQADLDNDYCPISFDAYSGICKFVETHPNTSSDIRITLNKLMDQWPLLVDGSFAVPASRTDNSFDSAKYAFIDSSPEHMWFTGEYAELRMELLNWMIKELENDNA